MYIGKNSTNKTYLQLDNLDDSFDGTAQSFNLTINSNPFYLNSSQNLIISLNGVIQESYTIDLNQITFDTAPKPGDKFFGIVLENINDDSSSLKYIGRLI